MVSFKNILSLTATLILFFTINNGNAQSLPIDFEAAVTTSDFEDFDGGTATVMANPQMNGLNTSSKVAQIVRDGGDIWSGSKIVLSSNLDFSVMNSISMKVYTTAPVGTKVKFKLEGVGETERDVLTTVSGEWEELTWDFVGAPSDFNTLVFMFDFGNTGDGSATSTFLFDDIVQESGGSGITLPINFEASVTTSDFVDFEGGTASVIANPQVNGINTSSTVAQIVRNGGEIWAGSKVQLASVLDLSSETGFTMKVYTTAPVGTTVKFKLEGTGTAERDVLTTVSGEWEELAWDFTGEPNNFSTIAFMFDFGNIGDGSATSTFLFDDVQHGEGGGTQIDLPVTFEGAGNYTMTDFGGTASSLMTDPINPPNMVMQVIKTDAAADWAGTTIGTDAGFATNIPFTLTETKMKVKVWSPDAGIPVRLKVEDAADPTHTCETEASTTVSGAWEVLEFDFANEASGTAQLSIGLGQGWVYNKASIFFNFGTDGPTAGEKTYYFDDVMFGDVVLGANSVDKTGFSVFPNPTTSDWTINSEQFDIKMVELFDIQGKRVLSLNPEAQMVEINAANLLAGVYFAKVATAKGTFVVRLVKK